MPCRARGRTNQPHHNQRGSKPTGKQTSNRTGRAEQATSEMGSFFSTMFTPPPAGDDPNSAVVAAHSKAAYDQQWEAAKSSGKLVSWPLLLFPFASPR